MNIAFLILPNMLLTSYSNAYELFFAAKMKARTDRNPIAKSITLTKIALTNEPIQLQSGFTLNPDQTIGEHKCDMIFVPALWRNPRQMVSENPEIGSWLKSQWERGCVLNATGTGVCFIADSGLLDYRAATTHWHYFDAFARDYPRVKLKRQHFITGANKLFCAASINAQTDLVLHHVHRFIGKHTAEHLSRHFSHEVRQPYDRLSFEQEKENAHPDESVLQAQLWIQNNLSEPNIRISDIAALVGMSPRNFNRRFQRATGNTPLQYLHSLRFREAQSLLKHSNLTISEIADQLGYMDVSYFGKLFKENAGVTPKNWRESIRGKLFK